MAEQSKKKEVRIPIPGTPAFIVQTAAGNSEEVERNNLNVSQLNDKVQTGLDEELAESFPASDPPAAVRPERCPPGTVRSNSGECVKDEDAA